MDNQEFQNRGRDPCDKQQYSGPEDRGQEPKDLRKEYLYRFGRDRELQLLEHDHKYQQQNQVVDSPGYPRR